MKTIAVHTAENPDAIKAFVQVAASDAPADALRPVAAGAAA
jgi:hypothetical protein